jgi:type VI protein secretion system component VasF
VRFQARERRADAGRALDRRTREHSEDEMARTKLSPWVLVGIVVVAMLAFYLISLVSARV